MGIKLAAGDIEKDPAFALQEHPDFITIDCRGGATGSSLLLKDNVGIFPLFFDAESKKIFG